jgi:protein-S-isoprenylcysteine O-methyltransferase Ste14
MHVVDIVIAVTWVAVLIYWLIAAANVKVAQRNRRVTSFVGVRVVVILVVLGLLRIRGARSHLEFTTSPWLQGVGLVVFVLGMALAVWARIYLGRNWGQPMSQKLEPELVTTGPYR